MELYEMRYFLAVAESQNVGKAAKSLSISSPSISRVISRLEEELGVDLFERVGRNIVLTRDGKRLQGEVHRVLSEVEDLKSAFKPSSFHVGISLIGTEFGVSAFLSTLLSRLKKERIEFYLNAKVGESSSKVERSILDGEAHLGLTTRAPSADFKYCILGEIELKTYVGPGHELYSAGKAKKPVHVEQVLRYEFASLADPFFPETGRLHGGSDGWRDDKFKRKIGLRTEIAEGSLSAVESGFYLGYFPEVIADRRDMLPIKITSCPYQCKMKVYLIAKKGRNLGWMQSFF